MRQAGARREATVSIIVNLALAGLTLLFALRLSSLALMAQAAHTASDVLSSIVVFVGSRVAGLPADREHPHGHGRAEGIATIVIAVLLGLVGLEFVRGGVVQLLRPEPVKSSWLVAGFMVGAAVVKEGLARYALAIGRRIGSPAVEADGHHHRADALAALMAGVAIAGVELGVMWFDGLLALGIAGIILKTAYSLGHEAASVLLGRCATPELLRQTEALAMAFDGVHEVHRIDVHQYGDERVITLHALVNPRIGVTEGHQIAEGIEAAINAHLAATTTVHIEPNLAAQSLRATSRNQPDH